MPLLTKLAIVEGFLWAGVAVAFIAALTYQGPSRVQPELFVLTISVCHQDICNDFDIEQSLSWKDCINEVDKRLETEPDLIWACVPVSVE